MSESTAPRKQVRVVKRELFTDVMTSDHGIRYSVGRTRRVRWMLEDLNGWLVSETRYAEFTRKCDGVEYADRKGFEVVR